jgi:hypothetical protein
MQSATGGQNRRQASVTRLLDVSRFVTLVTTEGLDMGNEIGVDAASARFVRQRPRLSLASKKNEQFESNL